MKGILENGFEYEIPDERLDDYELLEMFTEIDEGNNAKIIKVPKALLGEEQEKELKEHLRGENGVVKVSDMFKAIKEIMESSNEGKNS